jgi:hypothetical protein
MTKMHTFVQNVHSETKTTKKGHISGPQTVEDKLDMGGSNTAVMQPPIFAMLHGGYKVEPI